MAFEGSDEQVREEGVRSLSCESCVHSVMKARLIEFRFCNRFKVPCQQRCVDFMERKDAGKRES